jgi:LPXTG-motif cell wall-anchored protein
VENDTNFNAAADHTTLLVNTQGIELPSTGGMGTTILYIGGSILVILAAVLLITKRRMNAED